MITESSKIKIGKCPVCGNPTILPVSGEQVLCPICVGEKEERADRLDKYGGQQL